MKKILTIVGARPQFIKHAPMQLQLQKQFRALTLHTGQHYDENMSAVFFRELGIPNPDYLFDMSGTRLQGEQTGLMMREIEQVCLKEKPEALLVYGDTNSTLAGALVAAKLLIPLIHIEAGLRSYNRSMPEEINRIVADQFGQLLFCPTRQAIENLKQEGISHPLIFLCGDVMQDTLRLMQPHIQTPAHEPYYFATLHRPYNTDDPERLKTILQALQQLDLPVYFSVHPRTLARMQEAGLKQKSYNQIHFLPPLSYTDSLSYQTNSEAILTDSGGIQKEAYMLQKKCITLRSETEWIETLQEGWNTLVFEKLSEIPALIKQKPGAYPGPLYGDGHAAEEITSLLLKHL